MCWDVCLSPISPLPPSLSAVKTETCRLVVQAPGKHFLLVRSLSHDCVLFVLFFVSTCPTRSQRPVFLVYYIYPFNHVKSMQVPFVDGICLLSIVGFVMGNWWWCADGVGVCSSSVVCRAIWRQTGADSISLEQSYWGVLYTKKREKISKTRPPKTTKPRRPRSKDGS